MTQYRGTNFFVEPTGNVYKMTEKGLVKIGWKNSRNYIHITTADRKSMKVHRMVAELFIPNPKNYPHINHKNGITTDNRIENLEWVNPSQNQKHAYRIGLRKSKLSHEDRIEIIERIKKGEKQNILSKEYNITEGTVSKMLKQYVAENN